MNGRGIKAENHFRKIPLTIIPLTSAEFLVGFGSCLIPLPTIPLPALPPKNRTGWDRVNRNATPNGQPKSFAEERMQTTKYTKPTKGISFFVWFVCFVVKSFPPLCRLR